MLGDKGVIATTLTLIPLYSVIRLVGWQKRLQSVSKFEFAYVRVCVWYVCMCLFVHGPSPIQ